MKKTRLISIFSLVITATLFFICAIFSMTVHAVDYNDEQSGITLHQNYDITTANDGAYATKSVNPSLFTSGSYYTSLYSGGTVDVTNGYMYEAAATGSTSRVRLFDKYSGTFSIFGQGFYDADSKPFDYKRLAFVFTNNANAKQYIRFTFTQTDSTNYLTFNAYYYDKDIQETAIYKTSSDMNLMASFTATSNFMTEKKKTAFKFSYNNSTQELNLANSSSVRVHNLNTLLSTTLSAFSSYSVDMIFEEKSQVNSAKFVIYELCGTLLDVGVHDNYDITTANGGAYASKAINSTIGDSSYYKTNYAGETINIAVGRLYMAGAKNTISTIRLFDEHSGTFSIVGTGFYDADSSPFDYGKLSFIFTNNENNKQYIKFVFNQSASGNYLAFNAYYYDKDIQDSAVYKTSSDMNLRSSFSATAAYFSNKKTAFKFSYNNSTQALNLANAGGTLEHSLNTMLDTTLSAFSSYSVDMLFENKSQTTTAKFIAYEMCGVNFSESRTMTVKDMAGETVSVTTVYKGQVITLPENGTAGFVGYKIDGEIYPAGYAYTVDENFEMQQMIILPDMIDGASMRLTVDEDNFGGIRFGVKANDEDMSEFGDKIEMHGVLIYTDNIDGDFDLDEEKSVDKALNNYLTVNGERIYFITVSNIKAANYTVGYSVRAYLKITMYDGSFTVLATTYSAEKNSRTPYEVAEKAEEDGYSGEVIDAYLGR